MCKNIVYVIYNLFISESYNRKTYFVQVLCSYIIKCFLFIGGMVFTTDLNNKHFL